MNDIIFFSNFVFNEFFYSRTVHVDNSHGVENHFIGYMKSGSAKILADGVKLELKKGDMFYIPKGLKYHSYWKTGEDNVLLDSIGFRYFPTADLSQFVLQKIEYDDEIFSAFSPLSISKTIDCASVGRLYTLLGMLENVFIKAEKITGDKTVGRLIAIMKKDPSRSVAEYANDLGISETTLYNHLKRTLKKTPNRLRQEILCQKAEELLITTDLSVEDICDKCGFSSSSYFRKVLREITGKTPTEIRAEANVI